VTAPSDVFAPGVLDDHVALVTGGGTNLGLHAAMELARCGAHVVIAGRREEVLAEAVERIGPRASFVTGDIREADGARAIVDGVVERHGRIDTLLNNAGGQYFVPAESIAPKGWGAVQRLNVGGTLRMMETAVEFALPASGMTIVNVTVSPHHGMPGMAHTGVARAAVEQLGRDAAARWADRGVRVVAAAIGRFSTESLSKYPASVTRDMETSVPLQRLGRMEEFGYLVAMLASPLGASLSGSVVTLDGGFDNWFGPWPPPTILDDDGTLPTEARAPAR
jgi:citronellol/citronellal dehydrogenase